jgi:hypothetical protein
MNAKENLLRAIRHENPDWVPNGMEAVVTIHPPVVERPDIAGRDAFGVDWALSEDSGGGTYPRKGGNPVTDPTAWREQVMLPKIGELDWASVKTHADDVDRNENLVRGFVEMGLLERSCLLLGMEEALIAFVTEPAAMAELVAAIADYKIELIERFDDVADLDMVWYGDDWGTQNGLFLPPRVWRQVIRPHTQRIYDCMKARGILIDQHSCGRIEEVFADVVAMGADLWNPCQPCNDLAALKRQAAGRIAFCGGIDSQFVLDRPGVTAEEVRAEVRKRIDQLAGNGGYIAAPSHAVPYRRDLLDAMNDEIASYGRAFCRRSKAAAAGAVAAMALLARGGATRPKGRIKPCSVKTLNRRKLAGD